MPYFIWMTAARAALRKIGKVQAQQILIALTLYARTRQGITGKSIEPDA